MSKPSEYKTQPKTEHGTMQSYVIGFLLSLLFTAIPYVLVVNKVVSGSALLATIMGFAMVQMLVQIFFFLHLGRGPKPLYNVVFFLGTIGIILIVVGGSLFIMHNLHYHMAPTEVTKRLAQDESIYQVGGEKTGACKGVYPSHKVTISKGKLGPLYTEARLCDTLTFINQDGTTREITFGSFPKPKPYAGQDVLTVFKDRSKTITLNQTGTYHFYDRLDPETTGDFTVTK